MKVRGSGRESQEAGQGKRGTHQVKRRETAHEWEVPGGTCLGTALSREEG